MTLKVTQYCDVAPLRYDSLKLYNLILFFYFIINTIIII